MNNWNSIVVGIDFSASSKSALSEAARLARWHNCSLHLAHVIAMEKDYETPPESSTAISIAREQMEHRLKDFCLEHVEFLGDLHYHILVGHPFHELSQLTQDISADLLVLGACNEERPTRRIGAISSKCVRKSPVPVLLVRGDHENPYRDVMAALDFSPTSIKAAKLAADIAFENQSHLHLVHVHEPNLLIIDSPLCPPEGEESAVSKAARNEANVKLLECRNAIHRHYPDLSIETHFLQANKVSTALINFINSNPTGLAVLGTRGRTGLRSLLLGTTAERLINDCPCSVFTVKPDNFTYPR